MHINEGRIKLSEDGQRSIKTWNKEKGKYISMHIKQKREDEYLQIYIQ